MNNHQEDLSIEEQLKYYKELYDEQAHRNTNLKRMNEELAAMIQDTNAIENENEVEMRYRHRKQIDQINRMHTNELQIYKEKIRIYDRKQQTVQQQLQLFKKQIKEKDNKITYLNDKMSQLSQQILRQRQLPSLNYEEYEKLKIKVLENEDTIQILKERIEQENRKYAILQLREKQLANHYELKDKQYNTTKIEVQYYREENQQLSLQIQKVSQKLKNFSIEKKEQFQVEAQRWLKIQQNLLARIQSLQKNGNTYHSREDKLFRELKSKNELLEREKSKIKDLQAQISWLKKLLQQAKTQFISAQLQQDDKNSRLKNEKQQLLKETQRLKQMTKQNSKTLLNSRRSSYYNKSNTNKSIISLLEKTPQKNFVSSNQSKKSIKETTRKV